MQNSRQLAKLIEGLNQLAPLYETTREAAKFLGCSRRTARRALSYLRAARRTDKEG